MQIVNWKIIVLSILTWSCCTTVVGQQPPLSAPFTADFDTMWSGLRDGYAYFDTKATDWNRVRALYRPQTTKVKNKEAFVTLLEKVLEELYDHHSSLNTNLKTSPRLVPIGIDLWAEWKEGRAVITQLRRGFSAEQAGLKPGMEIVSIDGSPIEQAVARRCPRSLKRKGKEAREWALRAVLAGTHDQKRVIEAKDQHGALAVYRLDLPSHTTVDSYHYTPKVEWKTLPHQVGYIKINDLISSNIVSQFDSALEKVKASRGLILDLRDIPGGGNTDVAEPILGRFIGRRMGYQQVVPRHGQAYIKQVSPRGPWTYKAPLVVLVDRWTGSMGEGMAIGLDGMKRATLVGTHMAGLNGGIFNLELPNTRIGIHYAGEKLNHINGTPRERFVPPVVVDLLDKRIQHFQDPIFEAGKTRMNRLIHH